MNVFVLGGTGSIGSAVVAELMARNHTVVALSRSEKSDNQLRAMGANPVRGDLTQPDLWVPTALSSDAIIQVAATFGADMGAVDAKAMKALIQASKSQAASTRLIYTGGCWLYGVTGDDVATEDLPFDPLPAFAWAVKHAEMLLAAPQLLTAVIHPAMVYNADDGGVFDRYKTAAQAGQKIEIWGSVDTRWPLIESSDLAKVYCDLAARRDLVGHFNAVAESGVSVGQIAHSVSQAYGSPRDLTVRTVDAVMQEHGDWAKGPTLDQQMSAQKLKVETGWEPRFDDYTKLISGLFPGDQDA